MSDFPTNPDDAASGAATAPTASQLAAQKACEEAIGEIAAVADSVLAANAGEVAGREELLATLVERYADCSRQAGSSPERMLRPLKAALGGYFYNRREHADDLVRRAVLSYFEVKTTI